MQQRIKKSYACANVVDYRIDPTLVSVQVPQAGQVGIFKVLEDSPRSLKDSNGANQALFEGDLVMLAFGDRYATNQYEAYVPERPERYCNLVGFGGIAGLVNSMNATFKHEPLPIELVGYAVDETGKVINTIQRNSLSPFTGESSTAKVILSVGASMDSGKTTTAAYLCGGLERAGLKAAYIKLTGTSYPKDKQYVYDRGACFATDFAALGYPSTYLLGISEILNLYQTLRSQVEETAQPDYIVVEIADGLLQRETRELLANQDFMNTVDYTILSCVDSLGVISGQQLLNSIGIEPVLISGLFTASELLIREVQDLASCPIMGLDQLLSADFLPRMSAKSRLLTPVIAECA